MNVLMLTPMVPSHSASSAGAIVMYDEVSAVASRHDVTLATLTTAGDEDSLDALRALGVRVRPITRRTVDGVRGLLQRVRIGQRWRTTDLPLRTVVFHEEGMQRELDARATSPFDVVHVLDNAMASYRLPNAAATMLTEYEVRVDADDAAIDGSESSPEAAEVERQRWERYQSRVWSSVSRVQVFTERDGALVRRLAPTVASGVIVNPFGVDVPGEQPTPSLDGSSIVFVGGFRHPPNVDAAVWLVREILPLVHASRPDTRLSIVGADPPPTLTALVSDLVTVTGHVPSVEPFLRSAGVVVAPVRSGGGMRRKVLEAMAIGKAVVTTTRGAEGIWNPPTAPTIRVADDAAGIARHITTLLASPDERRALGSAARAAVAEHHQRTRFSERLLSLYESLRQSGVAA